MREFVPTGPRTSERKVAYFVLHPESSGGRMITELLVRAGVYGQYIHEQEMDGPSVDQCLFANRPDKIVFRRSIPHSRKWPDIVNIIRQMENEGYAVIPICIFRSKYYTVLSQDRNQHVAGYDEARRNIDRATNIILWGTYRNDPIILSYEDFVHKTEYRENFMTRLGLPMPDMVFYDGNKKYKT